MTELEKAIQAVEHGLLATTSGSEHPAEKKDLGQRMKYYKVPGVSAAFVYQGELAWAGGFGVMEAGSEKLVTAETIFQAASISKPFTAMVALHMVEAGLLDLDADANDFLRSWKIPKYKYTQARSDGTHPKVTLRGLLSHTAGMNIRGYSGYTFDRQVPTLQQILNGEPPANSKPVRVMQTPGKDFRYSGGGYLVAQQMIEDVSGRPLAVLAKEFIFDKLGMKNSTFDSKLPEVYLPHAATGHNKTGELVRGKWHIYPEQAAASLWTTPSDLARLIIETLKSLKNESNLVLSAEMTRQMLIPQISLGGVGFNVIIKDGVTRFGHPGWNVGFHSIMLGCPEVGQGLIWMTNGENGKRLGWEISRGVADIVGWTWW
ncbi:MAG: beta-lactamase family protein [Anaerolineae bacterium]|nr:beta-lactamase family protein [Anaerolineae bacterium]